eukprot:TRINITY_DN24266_c0_g1_i2.p1 TRINITY_DN24266_c0_g1~~TRINITY_DN24266_c0_g1_i2.p1  ORF type:complete len:385 (+),score=80.75 TRINITY_DN24266_c0_g1_i2:87-1241(+)
MLRSLVGSEMCIRDRKKGKAGSAAHVLDLLVGGAQYEAQDDGQLEIMIPNAKIVVRLRCEQTSHLSRDEVLFAWSEALRHVLRLHPGSVEAPQHEWTCPSCTMINPPGEPECVVCGSPLQPDTASQPGPEGNRPPDLFKSRVFTVTAPEGIAYRSYPESSARIESVTGPEFGDLVVSEMLCTGICGVVFAKCATGTGWVPLSTKGGRALLDELPQPGVPSLTLESLRAAPVWNGAGECPQNLSASSQEEPQAERGDSLGSSLARYAGAVETTLPSSPTEPKHPWQVHYDPGTGREYFHNPATGETSWTNPQTSDGMKLRSESSPKGSLGKMGGLRNQVELVFQTSQPEMDEEEAPPSPRNSCDGQNADQMSKMYPTLPMLGPAP